MYWIFDEASDSPCRKGSAYGLEPEVFRRGATKTQEIFRLTFEEEKALSGLVPYFQETLPSFAGRLHERIRSFPDPSHILAKVHSQSWLQLRHAQTLSSSFLAGMTANRFSTDLRLAFPIMRVVSLLNGSRPPLGCFLNRLCRSFRKIRFPLVHRIPAFRKTLQRPPFLISARSWILTSWPKGSIRSFIFAFLKPMPKRFGSSIQVGPSATRTGLLKK